MKIFRNRFWYVWTIAHVDKQGGIFVRIYVQTPEAIAADSPLSPEPWQETASYPTLAQAMTKAEELISVLVMIGEPWD